MHESLRPLILDINRPQYVMTPEAFVTGLALLTYDRDLPERMVRPLGYMYKSDSPASRTLEINATYPDTEEAVSHFAKALVGIQPDKNSDMPLIAEALASSVVGSAPQKGTKWPASPLTTHLALAQDLRGFQGAANPPDLGVILSQLYELGIPAGESSSHPAEMWRAAAEARSARDPLLAAMNAGVADALLPFAVSRKVPLAPVHGKWDLSGTPFRWLAEAWQAMTSEGWVSALPARIWVDWATTVLRLGFGMGFLWEATWFESLGRTIVQNPGEIISAADVKMPELLPWRPSDSPISVRDVASLLKWRVMRGGTIREQLLGHLKESGTAPGTHLEATLPLVQRVSQAISSPSQRTNMWEAIRYALKTRDSSGPSADHYGLLSSTGRYLTVEPGTEWMAVVASLACGPDGTGDVRNVMANLHSLGLQPELRDVFMLLENAGLARSSADADYGIEVRSAF